MAPDATFLYLDCPVSPKKKYIAQLDQEKPLYKKVPPLFPASRPLKRKQDTVSQHQQLLRQQQLHKQLYQQQESILKKTDIPLLVRFPFNPEIKRFALMILNLFIRTIALNVALYFGTSFATSYGPTYIAAYTIAINLWFLGAFLIDGYASAGNILSGKLLGAKDYKNLIDLSDKLIKYGIVVGLIMASIGAVLYYPIGRIFSSDSEVLAAFYDVFWIVLLMQPLCALAFIFDGVFKGLGKMKYLRNLLLFSTLLVFIPVIYYTDRIGLKLYGIFIAFTLWVIARGIPLIIKFRKTFRPLAQNS